MIDLSTTPETDAQVTTFSSISKLQKPFECSTGKVSAEFARKLERQRNEAQADRAHLIIIARDRLEKIRQLEREIEAATSLKSPISNLQSNP